MVLSQLLTTGPLSLNGAVAYAHDIATTLKRIHDHGSFCGSLDPSRIVLTGSGVDILAQESVSGGEEEPQLSSYIAPEQLDGKSGDARSDIFALGAVVFEMLTGSKAFPGDTPEDIRSAILEGTPQLSDDLERTCLTMPAEVRPAIVHLVSTCLEKNAEKRFSNMQKFLLELKLLTISIKRAEQRRSDRQSRTEIVLRAEIAGLEKMLTAGLSLRDRKATELEEKMGMMEEIFSAATEQIQAATQAAASVCTALAHLEENINIRLDSNEAATDELHGKIVDSNYSAMAELRRVDEALSAKISGLERDMQSQIQSMKSLETSCTQIEHLMGRTLDALDDMVEADRD